MKRDKIILMTNVKTGEVDYALTQVSCANAIGCSKQLVSQVLSKKEVFKYFKTAKGWKLEYVDFLEHVYSKIDSKPSIEKKLEKILTSGKTVGEMLAELQKLMPNLDFEEVDA